MSNNEAEKRIKKLRSEIARLREEYHVKNLPNITDDVYDSLNKELKVLLEKYPEFVDKIRCSVGNTRRVHFACFLERKNGSIASRSCGRFDFV